MVCPRRYSTPQTGPITQRGTLIYSVWLFSLDSLGIPAMSSLWGDLCRSSLSQRRERLGNVPRLITSRMTWDASPS